MLLLRSKDKQNRGSRLAVPKNPQVSRSLCHVAL